MINTCNKLPGTDIPNITKQSKYCFGLDLDAKAGLDFDVYVDIKSSGGEVDVSYPVQFSFDYPSPYSFGCKDDLVIKTSCKSNGTGNLDISAPSFYLEVGTKTKVGAFAGGCHNTAHAQQLIEVKDISAPNGQVVDPALSSYPSGSTIKMYNCTSPQLSPEGIIASDNSREVEVEMIDQRIASNVADILGYLEKWRCIYLLTDGIGNETRIWYDIELWDIDPPLITNVQSDSILPCDASYSDTIVQPTIVDNCDEQVVIDFKTDTVYDLDSNEALIHSWTANDASNNYSCAQQTIASCNFDLESLGNLNVRTYADLNENGICDEEEPFLDGVQVTLRSIVLNYQRGAVSDKWNEDAGLIQFRNVPGGYHQLELSEDDGLHAESITYDSTRFLVTNGLSQMFPLVPEIENVIMIPMVEVGDQEVAAPQRSSVSLQTSRNVSRETTFYPNPAKESIHFISDDEVLEIRIYHQSGKIVQSNEVGGQRAGTITIGRLQEGFYLFEFIQYGKRVTKTFIKM